MVTQFRQLAKAAGLSLALLLGPVAANAALIPITIDITLDSARAAEGSFEFNAGAVTVSTFQLFLDETACDFCSIVGPAGVRGIIDPLIGSYFLRPFTAPFFSNTVRLTFKDDGLLDYNDRPGGQYRFVDPTSSVPEPATLALLGLGLIVLAFTRHRQTA